MNKIKGSMDVRLSLDEVNHINDLIVRDTAKAVKADTNYDLTYCPVCGAVVIESELFCSKCGQRLDHDNKAL